MIYNVAADLLVLIHLAFIVFVFAGGFAVLRWSWLAVLHLPALFWGVLVEVNGWLCPLTPWENSMRLLAGEEGYSGGFIEHYIHPIIYPAGLTRDIQIYIGITLIFVNLSLYGFIVYRSLRKRRKM